MDSRNYLLQLHLKCIKMFHKFFCKYDILQKIKIWGFYLFKMSCNICIVVFVLQLFRRYFVQLIQIL